MSKPNFKYQEIMDSLEVDCPPDEFQNKETIAYRWVFDDMEDEQNFLPQYFKNPPRFQKSPPEIVCQAVGLSFFSSEENANQRFQILTRRMAEKVKYKIGKNIAEVILKAEDGEMSEPDLKGHFTLHPYEKANFSTHFKITKKL